MTGPATIAAAAPGAGRGRRAPGSERGAVAVLLVLLTPVLLAAAGLVLDGGRVIDARQRAADIAEQAARAGVDQVDLTALRGTGRDLLDPAAAARRACGFVATAEPGAGCLAVPGPGALTVHVRTATPTVLLGLLGIARVRTDSQATARPQLGVVTGEAG